MNNKFLAALCAISVLTISMPISSSAQKTKAKIDPLPGSGAGFSFNSDEFGNPCTSNAGDAPVIYDNYTDNAVDVSFKLVNLGQSILFVDGTGFVIPPLGPQARPRIMRMTLAPRGQGVSYVRIRAQTSDCEWAAIVQPH
jgi:hypothetical protein